MMNVMRLFGGRSASAPVARERLQILLSHERGRTGTPDLLEMLRSEILGVVSKHIDVDPDKVVVRMDRGSLASVSWTHWNANMPMAKSQRHRA